MLRGKHGVRARCNDTLGKKRKMNVRRSASPIETESDMKQGKIRGETKSEVCERSSDWESDCTASTEEGTDSSDTEEALKIDKLSLPASPTPLLPFLKLVSLARP